MTFSNKVTVTPSKSPIVQLQKDTKCLADVPAANISCQWPVFFWSLLLLTLATLCQISAPGSTSDLVPLHNIFHTLVFPLYACKPLCRPIQMFKNTVWSVLTQTGPLSVCRAAQRTLTQGKQHLTCLNRKSLDREMLFLFTGLYGTGLVFILVCTHVFYS